MKELLSMISQCTHCVQHLPLGPRPVVRAHTDSRIVVIGQAPGHIVHSTGVPWDDRSGNNLRKWMGIDEATFYDERLVALVPMGFCYPGSAERGDLPPRPECAPMWHNRLWASMPKVELTLLVGQYAQRYYLRGRRAKNLTETVRNYHDYLPDYFVLPHPSPRNNIWQKKNPWFAQEVIPVLKDTIEAIVHKKSSNY